MGRSVLICRTNQGCLAKASENCRKSVAVRFHVGNPSLASGMEACSARSAVRGSQLGCFTMKRMLMASLLAVAMAALADSSAWAFGEPGVGGSNRRIGRINGFWIQPTTGRLYDYSLYFAAMYPNLPGSQELLYGNPNYYRKYPVPSPVSGDPSYGAGMPAPGPNPTFGHGRHANRAQPNYGLPPGATVTPEPPLAGSTPPATTTPPVTITPSR
jgi:hypothetical protein